MQAKDIMSVDVVTANTDADVADIARLMLNHHISAVPIVGDDGRLVGIVSEADLIHRPELGVHDRRRAWWFSLFAGDQEPTDRYVKTHGLRAVDVMSSPVISVSEDTPISDIALLLEKRRISRVAVTRAERLVGIVSRGDLLRGLIAYREQLRAATLPDDTVIRDQLIETLKEELALDYVNVTVSNGIVHFTGFIRTERERKALHIAAESIAGVRGVEDHLDIMPRGLPDD